MTLYGLPILFALFAWWFSTGAIFFLDTRPAHTFRWSLAAVTALAAAAVWGVIATSGQTSVADAYAGFTYGLIVWGWLETAFYMGYMIGPRRHAPPARGTAWAHFREAVETTLYHELAAIALAAVLAAISWDMPNKLALWTFVLLWFMQLSAKLNVFLGVPNLAEEFLPQHLSFLRHYMARKPMNWAFPPTVTLATVVAALFGYAGATASTPYAAASFTMLASLAGLAVLEHWLLVVPLRLDVLWRWALHRRTTPSPLAGDGGTKRRMWGRANLGAFRDPSSVSRLRRDPPRIKSGAGSAPARREAEAAVGQPQIPSFTEPAFINPTLS